MRVIFTCVPQTGHILPLLPLAEAFSAQGDEVIIASGPDAADTIASRGLLFHGIGPPFDEWFGALRTRTRGVPGDGLHPSRILGYFTQRLFGEIGMARMLDDLMALCEREQPNLLVFDPFVFAAPLVAAATGSHPVLHTIGPLLSRDVLALVGDAVTAMWREAGLDMPPDAGIYSGTTLTICPVALDPAGAALQRAQPLRPIPPPVTPCPPLPVSFAQPDLPLVYVTLGTFSNNAISLFRLVLNSLADEAVNVVVTIGRDNDPAALAPWPSNTCVERFIPQAELLPHCSIVVHHAGAGTMFGALAHGLPAVALPQSADNFTIAALLQEAGVAITVMPEEVNAVTVQAAIHEAIENPVYREHARELAAEIAAMPSPTGVAHLLREQFVTR